MINNGHVDHLLLFSRKSLNHQRPQLHKLLLMVTVYKIISDGFTIVLILLQRHVFLRREMFSSIDILHSSWKLLCQQSCDVDVVYPEERGRFGGVVEQR